MEYVYVLMYDGADYEGVFATLEEALEQAKRNWDTVRYEEVGSRIIEVWTGRHYENHNTGETEFKEYNQYLIFREKLKKREV